MRLVDIMQDIEFDYKGLDTNINEIEIEDITYNSKYSKENQVFVCIKGETVDGHKYAKNAYEKGCRVFIVEDEVKLPEDAVLLFVENPRITMSKASANFFNNPSKDIKIIGVTGTKGKTTITNYISTVLNDAGVNSGVIGTNGIFYNGKYEKTVNTTPESYELHKTIRKMVDEGITCVCMEVSSGGIMMNRVDDIDFDIAIFSNLSQDHIGPKEHPTFEHYLGCKARLFTMAKYGIINIDDKYAKEIIKRATCEIATFSIEKQADIRAENIKYSRNVNSLGISFDCETHKSKFKAYITSPGTFSVYNALAVIAVCKHLGIDKKEILDSLQKAKVKG
ncbi:Mur ligase family protein, partial [Romboutsia sp.]|uniref:Mur ligase family protein n=1 Tax=Romboutsia sp. TaxID=1965302 RepID=UPI003F2B58DB